MKDLGFIKKDIVIPGLKNKYRILHITDSHVVSMTEDDEDIIINGGPHTGKKLSDFAKVRFDYFQYDGVTTAELFSQMCDRLGANPDCADVIVFTGDILDFYTNSCFDFVCENLKKLKTPFMFVPGNHDMIFSPMGDDAVRNVFNDLCGGNTEVQKHKLGELALIGIDDTRNFYTDEALADFEEAMHGEDNVILFQHVPLYTKGYHAHTVKRGTSDWSLGDEGICVGDSWKVMFEKIKAPDSTIKALICGDCHIEHESKLGNVTQYTSPLNAEYPPVLFTVHS